MKHTYLSEIAGGITGTILTIVVEWGHIITKGIETAILALIGGICGAVGGYLVAFVFRKLGIIKSEKLGE